MALKHVIIFTCWQFCFILCIFLIIHINSINYELIEDMELLSEENKYFFSSSRVMADWTKSSKKKVQSFTKYQTSKDNPLTIITRQNHSTVAFNAHHLVDVNRMRYRDSSVRSLRRKYLQEKKVTKREIVSNRLYLAEKYLTSGEEFFAAERNREIKRTNIKYPFHKVNMSFTIYDGIVTNENKPISFRIKKNIRNATHFSGFTNGKNIQSNVNNTDDSKYIFNTTNSVVPNAVDIRKKTFNSIISGHQNFSQSIKLETIPRSTEDSVIFEDLFKLKMYHSSQNIQRSEYFSEPKQNTPVNSKELTNEDFTDNQMTHIIKSKRPSRFQFMKTVNSNSPNADETIMAKNNRTLNSKRGLTTLAIKKLNSLCDSILSSYDRNCKTKKAPLKGIRNLKRNIALCKLILKRHTVNEMSTNLTSSCNSSSGNENNLPFRCKLRSSKNYKSESLYNRKTEEIEDISSLNNTKTQVSCLMKRAESTQPVSYSTKPEESKSTGMIGKPFLTILDFVRIPCYAVIFLSSIVGNTLVIITMAQNKKMRTITNVFLLNLVSTQSQQFILLFIADSIYIYTQELDKIIGTLVKPKESLFNMELAVLQPMYSFNSSRNEIIQISDLIPRNVQPFFH